MCVCVCVCLAVKNTTRMTTRLTVISDCNDDMSLYFSEHVCHSVLHDVDDALS